MTAAGISAGSIGETYLDVVADETYRYEQLSEFIARVLEHLLPWFLKTLVSWVNEGLEEEDQLCPERPAYIRFGVDTRVGLEPRPGRCPLAALRTRGRRRDRGPGRAASGVGARDLDRSLKLVVATEHSVRCGLSVECQPASTAP